MNRPDPDRVLRERLREEAGRLALPAIEVDAAVTEDALVRRVADDFGL